MIKFLNKQDNMTFLKFLLIGIMNTVVGIIAIFTFYNYIHLNYYYSSALGYITASIFSFLMNKYFTFNNKGINFRQVLLFAINIFICYVISYSTSKMICNLILYRLTLNIKENAALLLGMCFFTVLNFLGQKNFVFKQ